MKHKIHKEQLYKLKETMWEKGVFIPIVCRVWKAAKSIQNRCSSWFCFGFVFCDDLFSRQLYFRHFLCCLSVLLLNSGRIINVSSVKGLFVVPFCAAYTMTKYAVEAFSDALRLEMKRFGVTVTVVEPGNFGGATESINVCNVHYLHYNKVVT